MAIGGAYSIDKYVRTANHSPWFESVQSSDAIKSFVEAQLEKVGWQVDYIFSHTVPLGFEPRHAFLPGLNQSLVDKTTEKWLDGILRRVRCDGWFCGQYHINDQLGPVRIMYEDFLELEGEKGALYCLADPWFPYNYLAEVLKAERTFCFVLIPTNLTVIRHLREDYGRKVVLCYLGEDCREEYWARFVARGNSERFLELFVHGWDDFLGPMRDYSQGVHIVMEPREYLTDLLPRLEEERRGDTAEPVDDRTIQGIEETAADLGRNLMLYLPGDDEGWFYPIRDLDTPEERQLLDRLGRAAFEHTPGLAPFLVPKEMFPSEALAASTTEDRRALLSFVEDRIRFESEELKVCPDEEDAVR